MLEAQIVLTLTAFFTSILSGVIGIGGGVLLFGIMALYLPPFQLIPIHGLAQFASNLSRAALSYRQIDWRIIGPLVLGVALGSLMGSRVIAEVSENFLQGAVGFAILALTWMPKLKGNLKIPGKFFWVGVLNAFLSLMIGATGPLLAPFMLQEGLTKDEMVATQATGQVFVHGAKVITFTALGFVIGEYLPLVGTMVVASIAGSYCAKWARDWLPERLFFWIFRITVSLLAIRMILLALGR